MGVKLYMQHIAVEHVHTIQWCLLCYIKVKWHIDVILEKKIMKNRPYYNLCCKMSNRKALERQYDERHGTNK